MRNPATTSESDRTTSLYSRFSQTTHSLFPFTRRRVGFTLAGAFAFAGAAAAVSATSTHDTSPPASSHAFTVQRADTTDTSSSEPLKTPDNDSSSSTNSSVNANVSSNGQAAPKVQLNVNGRNVTVPSNGTTQQTVTSADGTSHTSVSASSNTSTEGQASNSSSTTFTLHVTSNSTTSGGKSTP